MDKKWILIICIIILVVIGFITYYNSTNHETKVKLGDITFQVPDGYTIGNSGKDEIINLTNGTNEIYIQKYDGKNVKKYVDKYIDKVEKSNKSVKISNFTVGKTLVYKSNLDNSTTNVHFWFVKNNNTYTIYSWDKNPKIDSIVTKLIESTN